MDESTHALIQSLHQSPYRFCLAVSGGGAAALGSLLDVPGGSRTILEAIIPYSPIAFVEFLGRHPESFCSVATSREMALRAHERAEWLAPGERIVGVGCTASLVSDRPKRGDHRFHVSIACAGTIRTYSLTLKKRARSRPQEEAVVDAVMLNGLAVVAEIEERVPLNLLPGEAVHEEKVEAERLAALVAGRVIALYVDIDGRIGTPQIGPQLFVAGSFNPVHEAHWRLAEVGARLSGLPAAFELSVTNVDKPPLSVEEIHRRLSQFTWRFPVLLTRTPTFVEKARLFPGSVFAVGADTVVRIVSPRYYGDSEATMNQALEEIRGRGCRFLVAGRHEAAGKFVKLADVEIPPAWRGLFGEIAESECCLPVSSTELRRLAEQAKQAPPSERMA
jgi:nicotinamide mononucleotide (NMN) deamidase PncC